MNPTPSAKLLVLVAGVVSIVGATDAAISGEWDLFVLFMIIAGVAMALGLRLQSRRPEIPIRRDLVRWLGDRASASGEPMSVVTDRAIATFRDRYGAAIDADEARQ
jgi:uncharacterized membrane protein YfcA